MNVYFVRHGQTTYNKQKTFQPIHSPLSELGIQQVESVTQRLSDTSFNKIFSSDARRAVDTAAPIAKNCSVSIQKTKLLREHKKPSEIIGKSYDEAAVQNIYQLIDANRHDPTWHYSDEENYYDFRNRLVSFMHELENEPAQNVLVVTHSLVIRLLTCMLLFGYDLDAHHFDHARWRMEAVNSGITVFQYNSHKWRLLTYNDIVHLAE